MTIAVLNAAILQSRDFFCLWERSCNICLGSGMQSVQCDFTLPYSCWLIDQPDEVKSKAVGAALFSF